MKDIEDLFDKEVESYVPSKEDGPHGPRDNEKQLQDIEDRTAEFEGHEAEEAEEAVEKEEDPFISPNVEALTLITLMRVYDVNMALLNEKNPEAGSRLHSLHERGKLLGSFPWLDVEE